MDINKKRKLLKAVATGELSVEAAFIKKPQVFIGFMDSEVFEGDNGRKYTLEQINGFNHQCFILPPNGRG